MPRCVTPFNAVAGRPDTRRLRTLAETADETAGSFCCAIYLVPSAAFGFPVGFGLPAFQ